MDRELLVRARAGDREAFEQIVLAKGEPFFRTALAIVGNDADARDATQETFVAAWRSLPGLRDLDRFDAWLGRILINECRMSLRHRRRVTRGSDSTRDHRLSRPRHRFTASNFDRL